MPQHDDRISLQQMIDHAREVVELTRARAREDLDHDRPLLLSTWKLIEIIGEAARRISPALRDRHPEIPWKSIVGTRDRLVHWYDEVNLDVLWRIAHAELPILIGHLEGILRGMERHGKDDSA